MVLRQVIAGYTRWNNERCRPILTAKLELVGLQAPRLGVKSTPQAGLEAGSIEPRAGRHRVARRWSRECDGTPGQDEKYIGTPVRGDIMRSVNIHDIFIKTQCTNNKNITT